MLSALPVVGPLFGADSAAVSAVQGNNGEAVLTAATSIPGTGLAKDAEVLSRFGAAAEIAEKLGGDAAKAEKVMGIHGVSTTADLTKVPRSGPVICRGLLEAM
jgi:hypothetical protein